MWHEPAVSAAAGLGGAQAVGAAWPCILLDPNTQRSTSLTPPALAAPPLPSPPRPSPPRSFLLPSYFPQVLRAVASLEGVALSVDPAFKLISAGGLVCGCPGGRVCQLGI